MKSLFTDHLGLKLISLLMGFSLWYAVASEQEAEFALSIPIELRDLPEGLEVIEESVQQVEVRLRGPAEILRRLTPQDVNIGVELADAEPGERLAYLTPRDVSVPFGARVMRVTPTSVRIVLDRTMERTVDVIPRVVGSPAEGFELFDIELFPVRIGVVGPSALLSGLEQVTTEPVSADGLREPYSRSVRVELDPLVRLAREMTVEITLDVQEERMRRELRGVALRAVPSDVAARLAASEVRVLVEGPKSIVGTLSAADFDAELPLLGLASGRHSVAPVVRAKTPEALKVRVVSVKPESVVARIP
jgi:YbbR domain-containing protein